jgi:XTP/dITP diphosphohydrolase
MTRRFTEQRLVIASHNPGKVREIAHLLAPFRVDVASAAELDLPEPEETGASFAENAILKAHAATLACGLPALADDSGLAVDALDGRPGIHSARWAGEERNFAAAMARLEREMEGMADRRAQFVCALALSWPTEKEEKKGEKRREEGVITETTPETALEIEVFEGIAEGTLVFPPRGGEGFGYDPVFLPEDCDVTFGEMAPGKKHAISHRADAFARLVTGCFGED